MLWWEKTRAPSECLFQKRGGLGADKELRVQQPSPSNSPGDPLPAGEENSSSSSSSSTQATGRHVSSKKTHMLKNAWQMPGLKASLGCQSSGGPGADN